MPVFIYPQKKEPINILYVDHNAKKLLTTTGSFDGKNFRNKENNLFHDITIVGWNYTYEDSQLLEEEYKQFIKKEKHIMAIRFVDRPEGKTFKCPYCNGDLIPGKFGYWCPSNKDFKSFGGIQLSEKDVENIITKGKTEKKHFKFQSGKEGDGYICKGETENDLELI